MLQFGSSADGIGCEFYSIASAHSSGPRGGMSPWEPCDRHSGQSLGNLAAILAETVFVYERSEGLTGLNDSLEVPEREESHLVPGWEASWGHLGRGPRGTKKRTHFGVGLGVGFGAKNGSQNGFKIDQKIIKKMTPTFTKKTNFGPQNGPRNCQKWRCRGTGKSCRSYLGIS